VKLIVLKSSFPKNLPPLPKGKWSALSQTGVLVAAADTLKEVLEKARLNGENEPIVTGDLS